jgi:uncharacterized membrane protein YqjE
MAPTEPGTHQADAPPDQEHEPDIGNFLNAVSADAVAYVEARRRLFTLNASEKAGRLAGKFLLAVVVFLITIAVFVMAGLALALYMGRWLGDNALGFLATAGIFVVLALLFYLFWRLVLRDRITLSVINAVHAEHEHLS